jgi:DNA-binding CsgD family transcriptional regulator
MRKVRPDDLALWQYAPGVAAVARNESLAAVWCNAGYASLCGRPIERLLGTRMGDVMPAAAAEEREAQLREVMRTGMPVTYVQFGADTRLLCAARPLDAEAFGHAGVLTTIQEAPSGVLNGVPEAHGSSVLRTPCLAGLGVLSPRELEVLYHLSVGEATAEIADRLHRSAKTVDKHIESIHRKLRTSSRAAIVRLGVEKGIDAFTESEWLGIVEGSRRTRSYQASAGEEE